MASYDRKDHFHQRAKREGHRSRAVYKLFEVQKAQRLLRPGMRVVDLGCWPGGWLEAAAEAVGAAGRAAGVDLSAVDPPLTQENALALCGDLADPAMHARLREFLGGLADVVLSDAAPKLTGIRATDRAREEALLEAIEASLGALLAPGGSLLLKILDGPEAQQVERRVRSRFEHARVFKPRASRKGTTERYLLARGYRPEPG